MSKTIDRNRLYNYLYSLTISVLSKRNIKFSKKALKSDIEDWCNTILKNTAEMRVTDSKVILYYKDDYARRIELSTNILK